MSKFTVTLGALTNSYILVTIKNIEVESADLARLLALGMMAVPELWAISSLVEQQGKY